LGEGKEKRGGSAHGKRQEDVRMGMKEGDGI